jgi:hypothetical protein
MFVVSSISCLTARTQFFLRRLDVFGQANCQAILGLLRRGDWGKERFWVGLRLIGGYIRSREPGSHILQ